MSPAAGHAVAGAHAAGAALPPLQKKPGGQAVPELFAEPVPHAYPGAAAHGAHADASTALIAAEKFPTPHCVGAADPAPQNAPAGHGADPTQNAFVRFTSGLYTPASHGAGSAAGSAQ